MYNIVYMINQDSGYLYSCRHNIIYDQKLFSIFKPQYILITDKRYQLEKSVPEINVGADTLNHGKKQFWNEYITVIFGRYSRYSISGGKKTIGIQATGIQSTYVLRVSKSNWAKVQAVQNIGLGIILAVPYYVSNCTLQNTAGLLTIRDYILPNTKMLFYKKQYSQNIHTFATQTALLNILGMRSKTMGKSVI